MKHLPLILALGMATLAFEKSAAQEPPANKNEAGYWEKLTMQAFVDNQGMTIVEMPFPSTWKVHRNPQQGQPAIEGPNGIKVFNLPAKNFMFVSDPAMRRVYQQSGQAMRAMPGIGPLIQQDLVPWCANLGLRFLRHYEIPEVAKVDQWYNDQLFKAVPGPTKVAAIGSDWLSETGEPNFIITHLTVGITATMQNWYYRSTGLQAEKSHFETAKKQLLFALTNARYNPQQIRAYNQSEAKKAGQSWAAHNKRMAENQAAFEASQRAHVNRSNAINNAIMSGWRERNAASDKAHGQFIDTINEKTNVVDPSTGQRFKVDSGSNHYWMNRDGKYLSSDQSAYNPNLDEAVNQQNWQKLENAE